MNANLQHQLRDALAAAPSNAAGPGTIRLEHAGQRLTCELAELDSLACAFLRLSVGGDRLAGASIHDLKQAAKVLSGKLTYLLEPISPIEVDADHTPRIDYDHCKGCMVCVAVCPPHAIHAVPERSAAAVETKG